MAAETSTTQENILFHATAEFLEKGFSGAYLRDIARKAGITTGAIYGYYPNKEALFAAVIRPVLDEFKTMVCDSQDQAIKAASAGKISFITEDENDYQHVYHFLEYIYDHFDIFKLILTCSEGSGQGDLLHFLAEQQTEQTKTYLTAAREHGLKIEMPTDETIHILITAYFNAMFEAVIHDMPRETALQYAKTIAQFFNSGWATILKL